MEIEKRAQRGVKRRWMILIGQLVDVGGYRLHIECQGTGNPTVIMEAGLNMNIESWGERVPRDIAKFTRVCVYERAGIGESDRADRLRTSERIVQELEMLLQNAGERPPFILAGHSFGGINARLFSSRHPQDIAGLVLIDASSEDEYARYAALKESAEREKYLRHESGENFEGVNLLASADEIRNSARLPPVPLVVLSAQNDAPQSPIALAHDEMQTALAHLVPDGKLVVVQKSGHFIQLDQPQAVVDAVREVYEKAKNAK